MPLLRNIIVACMNTCTDTSTRILPVHFTLLESALRNLFVTFDSVCRLVVSSFVSSSSSSSDQESQDPRIPASTELILLKVQRS